MDKWVDKTALDGKRLPREWKEETNLGTNGDTVGCQPMGHSLGRTMKTFGQEVKINTSTAQCLGEKKKSKNKEQQHIILCSLTHSGNT